MPSNNLKPQLQKYSYDSLMTKAILEKQEGLIKFGENKTWDFVLSYIEDQIKPMFDFDPDLETIDIVLYELKEARKNNVENQDTQSR